MMGRLFLFFCLAAAVFGVGLRAQEFDISKLPIGYEWRWRADNGNTKFVITGHLKGRFTRDSSKGQPLEATVHINKKGEATRFVAKHLEIRFTPHDCSLTLGDCEYRMKETGKPSQRMRRVSSVQNGIWSYEVFAAVGSFWRSREKGRFEPDEIGGAIWRTYTQNGRKRWSKRLE